MPPRSDWSQVVLNRPKFISMLGDVRITRGRNDARFRLSFVRIFLPAVSPRPMLMRVRLAACSSPRECLRCPPALCRMTILDHERPRGAVAAKRAEIGRICPLLGSPTGLEPGNAARVCRSTRRWSRQTVEWALSWHERRPFHASVNVEYRKLAPILNRVAKLPPEPWQPSPTSPL
jgi:hypothetical protein